MTTSRRAALAASFLVASSLCAGCGGPPALGVRSLPLDPPPSAEGPAAEVRHASRTFAGAGGTTIFVQSWTPAAALRRRAVSIESMSIGWRRAGPLSP